MVTLEPELAGKQGWRVQGWRSWQGGTSNDALPDLEFLVPLEGTKSPGLVGDEEDTHAQCTREGEA